MIKLKRILCALSGQNLLHGATTRLEDLLRYPWLPYLRSAHSSAPKATTPLDNIC